MTSPALSTPPPAPARPEPTFVDMNRPMRARLEMCIEQFGDALTPAPLFGMRGETCYILCGALADCLIQLFGSVIEDGRPDYDSYRNWLSGYRCGVGGDQVGWWCHEDDIAYAYLTPDGTEVEVMVHHPWWDTSPDVHTRRPPEVLLLTSRYRGQFLYRIYRLHPETANYIELAIRFNDRWV